MSSTNSSACDDGQPLQNGAAYQRPQLSGDIGGSGNHLERLLAACSGRYYVGNYTRHGVAVRKVRTYAASPARIGNSRGYRMDAALFQEHPELREGAFEAAYIGTGTLLLRQRHARRGAGMRANDDADPIVAAYLAWTERVMAQQPALLRPLTRREFELAEKLVAEVEIDLEKDRLPDDFVLP